MYVELYNCVQMSTTGFKCVQIFKHCHWLHIRNNLVQPPILKYHTEVPLWSTTNRVSPVDIIVVTSKTGGFKKLCVLLCVLQKSTSKKYYKKVLHLQNRQDLSFLMVFSKNILFILRSVRCWWRLYVFRTEKSHLTWFDLMLYWYKLHHDNHICYKLQVVIMYSLQIRLQKWPKGPCSKREATHRAGAPTWYLWNVVQMLYKMLYTVCHCCL